jgi:hypothetical protein
MSVRAVPLLLVATLALAAPFACDSPDPTPWQTVGYPTPPLNWGPASTPQFPADRVAGDIVGVWFLCRDQSCSSIDSDGLLFRADGTWAETIAPGTTMDDGEAYCEQTSPVHSGTYSWDGTVLRMTSQGQTMSWVLTIEGDRGRIQLDETASLDVVRVNARSSGACEDDY